MDALRCDQSDKIKLYTADDAARLMSLNPQTLANWRAGQGDVELPFVKIGRAVRYRHLDIVAYIQSNTFKSTAEADG